MKNFEFWAHKNELFIGLFFMFLSLSILLYGIIQTTKVIEYWPIIPSGVFCIVLTILSLLWKKRVLAKVAFSKEGVESNWLGKKISYIGWFDIIDIKAIPHGTGPRNLCLIATNEKIEVTLSQKMYDTIMQVCPNPLVKIMINDLECFKYFH